MGLPVGVLSQNWVSSYNLNRAYWRWSGGHISYLYLFVTVRGRHQKIEAPRIRGGAEECLLYKRHSLTPPAGTREIHHVGESWRRLLQENGGCQESRLRYSRTSNLHMSGSWVTKSWRSFFWRLRRPVCPLCHTRSAARAAKLYHRDGSCRHRHRSIGSHKTPHTLNCASCFWLGSNCDSDILLVQPDCERLHSDTIPPVIVSVTESADAVFCIGGRKGAPCDVPP